MEVYNLQLLLNMHAPGDGDYLYHSGSFYNSLNKVV